MAEIWGQVTADWQERDLTLTTLTQSQCEHGRFKEALEALGHIYDPIVKSQQSRYLSADIEKSALTLVLEGKIEEALEQALLVNEKYRGGTLSRISQILQDKGDREGALKIEALIPSGKTLFL